MSSSDADSKIDLLDPPDSVNKKIKKALGIPKVTEDNALLAFTEHVLLPSAALRGNREFVVEREKDGLPPLSYNNIEKMTEDYKNDLVSHRSFSPSPSPPPSSTLLHPPSFPFILLHPPSSSSGLFYLPVLPELDQKLTSCVAYSSTSQTSCCKRDQSATCSNSRSLSSFKGMARSYSESLPSTTEKREEGQEDGYNVPRCEEGWRGHKTCR